jgi:menaquinone-dependent protoporphyrinogen oxidase
MKTAIIFSGKHGCTEKCAAMVKADLADAADLVNLKEVKKVNLEDYDTVIVGGSVYIGKIRKEVRAFCQKHQEALKKKKLGLFVVGMAEGDALQTELETNFPAELQEKAIAKGLFGGEFIIDQMHGLEKFIVKKIAKTETNVSKIRIENIHAFAMTMK